MPRRPPPAIPAERYVPCRWCKCDEQRPITAAPAPRLNDCKRQCPCHFDERWPRPHDRYGSGEGGYYEWEDVELDRIFDEVWTRDHPGE